MVTHTHTHACTHNVLHTNTHSSTARYPMASPGYEEGEADLDLVEADEELVLTAATAESQ